MSYVSEYISSEKDFVRIGPSRARQLFEAHGSDLIDALREGSFNLPRFNDENTYAITQAAKYHWGALNFARDMDGLGIDDLVPAKDALAIIGACRWTDVGTLANNPFVLSTILDWKMLSKVADRLGVDRADPRFVLAACEEELRRVLSRGDTCVLPDILLERVRVRMKFKDPLPVTLADDIVEVGLAERLGPYLQPTGAAYMEAETALVLREMAASRPCTSLVFTLPTEAQIQQVVDQYLEFLDFDLTDMQKQAVTVAHSRRLMILGGYAGSGKTTVLDAICYTMERLGREPKIITLSGRAAQRASEATGRKAITIARFLMDQTPLTERDLLIIDEASMVALPDLWKVLNKIGDASLILCGDPAQLPPISFGLVFHVLTTLNDLPSVLLDRVMRQDERTGIPRIAEGIRYGRLEELPTYEGIRAGVSFIPCADNEVISLLDGIKEDIAACAAVSGDFQCIGAIKAGAAGVDAINQHFHEIALQDGAAPWPRYGHICAGEPFIFKKNDAERDLTNGSMGYIEHFNEREILVTIDGRQDTLRPSDWHNVGLAHAITVHKSQGSQWDIVAIPVFSSFILDRALIYTALTRAKTQVIFMGDPVALRLAVESEPKANDRVIGFGAYMEMATTPF